MLGRGYPAKCGSMLAGLITVVRIKVIGGALKTPI
jgi:hypothetical protein